jgi:hypothetical protein
MEGYEVATMEEAAQVEQAAHPMDPVDGSRATSMTCWPMARYAPSPRPWVCGRELRCVFLLVQYDQGEGSKGQGR